MVCYSIVIVLTTFFTLWWCLWNMRLEVRCIMTFCSCDGTGFSMTWYQLHCQLHMTLIPTTVLEMVQNIIYYLWPIISIWRMHWWHHQHHMTGNMLLPGMCQNCYAFQMPHIRHICQLVNVHIWDNCIHINASYKPNLIYNVTRNTDRHTFYIIGICPYIYWHMLPQYASHITHICPTAPLIVQHINLTLQHMKVQKKKQSATVTPHIAKYCQNQICLIYKSHFNQ